MSAPIESSGLVCRLPLIPKGIKSRGRFAPVVQRIINYNPEAVFGRVAHTIVPHQRHQVRSNLSLHALFPKKRNGLCDCGCGQSLKGRQTRWAAPQCSDFAWHVYAIIAGRREEIKRCLIAYHGRRCAACGMVPKRLSLSGGRTRSGIEFDHILPVHRGGGACWLSNYRLLCTVCHKQKTAADRLAAKEKPADAVQQRVSAL